ncbi:MAG TPA: formylglycine-generating enzyme family protein [Terracidiphilus sp.]|jgi:formylglycine-generating enzyme required for sulfatase activity|nr:formylglycine-generating enzyme family protein [Terracidiphilus sp.]
MMRTLASAFLLAPLTLAAAAQDTAFPARNQQIPPPECMNLHHPWESTQPTCPPFLHERWLYDLEHWRAERRIRIAYDPSRYEMPALRWTQSSFIQPQMMAHDRYFYDSVAGKYTVDRYLDDLENRYGGIDAVLIWATYPNMGVDDRNQLQMVESMPGGINGLRQMVSDFHRRGVRVLFPMMMWDEGTRAPDQPWPEAIAVLMNQIGADGINGDTQDGVPLGFSLAAEKIGHPLAFEPEGSPSDEAIAWNVMTWGQYAYPFIPMIDRFKWLETRHMVNISDRWNQDKTSDLQFAFFNGVGWESWENVWGYWNGITPRDAEATRRVAAIERGVAAFLVSPDWEPLFPMRNFGAYASRWPLGSDTVWTIVNRTGYDMTGPQMDVPAKPGMRYFDLYHGIELQPETSGPASVLSFPIEGNGYGAILATPGEPSAPMQTLMRKMTAMTAKPLASFSHQWQFLPQTTVPIASTAPATGAPEGMVRIPGGTFDFRVRGNEIEGDVNVGIDVQYPWEDSPRRFHDHVMNVKPFFLDRYPVTNAQFKRFLDATHYVPRDAIDFLRDWKNGTYPDGWDNRPVTWVSLEDARAYALWAGKRLPHEWEWQFAAQGTDGRAYPWGDQWQPAYMPTPDKGRSMRGPDPVDAHPEGASPFGVMDLAGNVWQWTDEFQDDHTRAAIVRGGNYYQPQGSIWYFPARLPQRRTRQGLAHGPRLRPLRRHRFPLRARHRIAFHLRDRHHEPAQTFRATVQSPVGSNGHPGGNQIIPPTPPYTPRGYKKTF